MKEVKITVSDPSKLTDQLIGDLLVQMKSATDERLARFGVAPLIFTLGGFYGVELDD